LAAIRSKPAYHTALWLNRSCLAIGFVWIWLVGHDSDSWLGYLVVPLWITLVALGILTMVMYRRAGVPMRFGRVNDWTMVSAMYRDVLWLYRRPRPLPKGQPKR
jgi:hypothetical protein